MADLLITHGIVVTMDPARRVLRDGAVAIEDGTIIAVGPTAAVAAAHRASRTIDASGKVAMPGLIDSHAHGGHGLVKTMGGGDTDVWFRACEEIYARGSDESFWQAEAALAALERLKCGTTTGVSLLGGGDHILRCDDVAFGTAYCQAIAEIGIRGVVAVGPCRPPFPKHFSRWRGATAEPQSVSFAQQHDVSEALIKQWHRGAGGRLRMAVSFPVHDPIEQPNDAVSLGEIREQAAAMRALARRYGVVFTQDGHKGGTIELAHREFDLLGPDALFAHCIDLTERDIALCREHDVKIVHNPSSIMSIRGRCPATELIDAGVAVALGSDGPAPDRSLDMFRHVSQCMHYHRRHFRDARVLPPGKALEMVTIDAARALGLETEIGSLEPGKRADIILIDMVKPHLYPANMPIFRLAHFANGADVDTTIVDGRVLMEGRKVSAVDEARILDQAQHETVRMLERTGLGHLCDDPPNLWRSTRF